MTDLEAFGRHVGEVRKLEAAPRIKPDDYWAIIAKVLHRPVRRDSHAPGDLYPAEANFDTPVA